MSEYNTAFEGFMLLTVFVGGPIAFFVIRGRLRDADRREIDRQPEQTFKVNVAVVPIPDDSPFIKMIRGRRITHNLEVDVVISPRDWQHIKDAGLLDAPLFEYPDTTSTYSGVVNQYPVKFLTTKGAASFYNLNEAEAAKEKLIESLYNLRDAIEVQKEGRQSERLEI